MNGHPDQQQQYAVSISEPAEPGSLFVFTFVPKLSQNGGAPNRALKRVPQFIVAVRQPANGPIFDWSATPDDPGAARAEIETEIVARLTERSAWISRVSELVGQVEQWARELGWATRRIEKKLEDARIGKHRVPALVMQEDTCRVLLEPIGRSVPGAEGVVDLYLMPAYDDIATLYYYADRWHLHYLFPGGRAAPTVREADALPLTKETLEKVLAEMRQHAA